jgi:putative transport protein
MDFLKTLLLDPTSVAHIVLLYALVISVGVYLGKQKVFGISLGVTFVLFAGIVAGHFGLTGTPTTLNFLQDFGLILFVYCIGLQVGPGFFESFGKSGLRLNILAMGIILLNVGVMFGLYFLCCDTSNADSLPMMVGVLCGAVTNTPGLGAANEALGQVFHGTGAPQIASGYACAYPLGVVGIIGATIAIRAICKIKLKNEEDQIAREVADNPHVKPHLMTLKVVNPALDGKNLMQIRDFLGRDFVCSRSKHEDHVSIPGGDTVLHVSDMVYIVCAEEDAEAVTAFIGTPIQMDWESQDMPMVSKRVVITRPSVNGKTLGQLHFSSVYGVNVTRLTRSGMELFADRNLRLQMGDRMMVVGPQDAVERVSQTMGNSVKVLDHPNISIIFIGILLGVVVGSIPIAIPGIPTPVKLGLAGGPLIVAILLGRWGYKLNLVTYTRTSANLMLREFGLVLFLASVGIKAGANFVQTVVEGDGLMYVWTGFLITVVPILVIGVIARMKYHFNYFTLMGMIAGSTTDPPALAYANQTANNDAPAVGYSTVYPLSMFLRIITAQMIVLLCCG